MIPGRGAKIPRTSHLPAKKPKHFYDKNSPKKKGKTTRPFRYDLSSILYDYTMEVTNRFKGLDMIEWLKNYGQRFVNIAQEAVNNIIPKEKKCKKAKWLSEEALQIAEKKRSERQRRKGKINPLNAEFQRIARRDKKALLSDQCKEIEENNGMGKTRDLFKKTGNTK